MQAEPLESLLVFGMLGIGESYHQSGVTMGVAAVLGRARAASFDTDVVRQQVSQVRGALDDDVMRPAIAEVVLVGEARSGLHDLVEAVLAFAGPPQGRQIGSTDAFPAHSKLMQVGIGLAHRDLQDAMELTEIERARDQQPTPNRGAHVTQGDLDLVDLHTTYDVVYRGRGRKRLHRGRQ
jgi:hypothetical protein